MGMGVRYFKKGMNEDAPDDNFATNNENEVQLPKEIEK